MKTQKLIPLCGTGVVVIIVSVALMWDVFRKTPRPGEPAAPPHTAATIPDSQVEFVATPPPVPAAPAEPANPVIPPPPQLENVVAETTGAPAQAVRLRPDQTLGTVNGVAITLKDLVPLPPDKAASEQIMSAEMFEFLFNRAMERELTFQAARAQGVELTEAQMRSLADLQARSGQVDPNVFDTVQQNPANTEFMVRDFSGLMLQATLAARAGLPSQYVTPEHVERFYREHRAEYGELPSHPAARQSAWRRIDAEIRGKLAPQIEDEYTEKLERFIQQIKAGADITINPPPAA